MESINQTLNKKLILTAFKSQLKIHVNLVDGYFKNGTVKEMSADFFIMKKNDGYEEPIFYIEVRDVEPYIEKKKEEK